MFSKIYRITTKFYGNPRPEAFEDAMISYASGYFAAKNVFYAEGPGDVAVWKQAPGTQEGTGENKADNPVGDVMATETGKAGQSPTGLREEDPNRATMRINLNGIEDHNIEVGPASKRSLISSLRSCCVPSSASPLKSGWRCNQDQEP